MVWKHTRDCHDRICSANSFIRVTLEALAQNILDIKCVEKVNTDHAHGCDTVLIHVITILHSRFVLMFISHSRAGWPGTWLDLGINIFIVMLFI